MILSLSAEIFGVDPKNACLVCFMLMCFKDEAAFISLYIVTVWLHVVEVMLPTWFAINALTILASTAQVLLAATVARSLLSVYDLIAACLSVMSCQLDCLCLLAP